MQELLMDYYQSLCERVDMLRNETDLSLQDMIELDILNDVIGELGEILSK